MHKILENNLDNFDKNYSLNDSKYLVQMHSQAKTSGSLEVYGVEKSLNPNLRPEKQHAISKQGKSERPQMGQGRAGSKRRKPDPLSQIINQPSDVTPEIPGRTKIVTGKTNCIHSTNSMGDRLINNNPFMPDVPFHLDLLLKILNNSPSNRIFKKLTLKLILTLKKIHHFKKASCWRLSKDQTNQFSKIQKSWVTL